MGKYDDLLEKPSTGGKYADLVDPSPAPSKYADLETVSEPVESTPDTGLQRIFDPTTGLSIEVPRIMGVEVPRVSPSPPPGEDYHLGKDLVNTGKEVPKGFVRGAEQAGASVGSVVEAGGDIANTQGKWWNTLAAAYSLLQASKGKQAIGVPVVQKGASKLESGGESVSQAGELIYDFWTEAANTGWEKRDPEIYKGSFRENPSIARVFGSAFESGPTMIGALTLSAAGAPGAGAMLLAGSEAAPIYTEAKRKGLSEKDAFSYAFISGVGTAYIEKWGLSALTGKIPVVNKLIENMGANWVAGALVNFAAEGSQEAVQEIYQNAVALGYGEDVSVLEGALEAGLSGGLMGSVAGGSRRFISDYMTKQAESSKGLNDQQIDAVVREAMQPEQINVVDESGQPFRNPAVDAEIAEGAAPADVAQPVKVVEGKYKSLDGLQVVDESDAAVPDGQMRGFAERVSQDEQLTEEQRADIKANPENYYEPQHYDEMADLVDEMSREQKLEALQHSGVDDATGNENLGVMAGLSVYQEEVDAGRDPGWVVESLAKKGTTTAQLLAQFRLLKQASPDYALAIFEQDVQDKTGLQLKPQQREGLKRLLDADIKAAQELNAARKAMGDDPNKQTVDAFKKQLKASEKTKRAAYSRMAELSPRKMSEVYRDIIRGNLLVLKSHKRNILSNVIMRPIFDAAQSIGSVVDAVDAQITGRRRALQRPSVRGSIRGIAQGFREAGIKMKHGGGGEEFKAERTQGFKPVSAWKQLRRGDMAVNEKGRVPFNQYVTKLTEATFGIAPEINFRLLALGDDPFKHSVYQSNLEMEARKRGLKGFEKKAFILAPPAKVADQAMKSARESVFQSENLAGSSVSFARKGVKAIPVVGQWIDAAIITPTLPYIQTPANVAKILVKLSMPEVTLSVGTGQFLYGRKNNNQSAIRRGEMNMGYAAVGATLKGAALWLVAKGLVSEPPSDDEKERTLSYQTTKPGRLNVSALERVLNGEEEVATWRDGDKTVNLISLGFPGAVVQIQSRQAQLARRDARRRGDVGGEERVGSFIDQAPYAVTAALQATMDQSFVQGVYNVLDSLVKGETESLVQDWARASTAVIPNTVSTVNRARQTWLPDTKLDRSGAQGGLFAQAIRNAVNERNPFVDWDEVYPHRFNPLGEPIRRTPEGVQTFIHHLWSDTEPVNMDPRWREIREVYIATDNRSVIPTNPDRSLTVDGKRMVLSNEQYERYNELVGKARGFYFDELLKSKSYKSLSVDGRAIAIKRMFARGSKLGRKQFVNEAEFNIPVEKQVYPELMTLPQSSPLMHPQ